MKPGERIRELRIKKNQNQKQFGDIIGFSRAYVSEIERGVKPPTPEFLRALQEKFGVCPATILWGFSRYQWETIHHLFRAEISSDDLFEKLREFLQIPKIEHQYSQTLELPVAFDAKDEHVENRHMENASLRRLINKVIRIWMNGGKKVLRALESNIEAFLENIELRKPKLEEGD